MINFFHDGIVDGQAEQINVLQVTLELMLIWNPPLDYG